MTVTLIPDNGKVRATCSVCLAVREVNNSAEEAAFRAAHRHSVRRHLPADPYDFRNNQS